jgi:uncharacterized protein
MPPAQAAVGKKERSSFLKKKKQKTFANGGVGTACMVRDSARRSLLVLFFRKEKERRPS